MGTYSRTGSHRINGASAFFAQHGYLEVPSLVQWMATLKCGLSCAHCPAVSEETGFADMPLANVQELIDKVAALGVDEFLITGGEPLARADLAEVIAYLGRKQVSWTLNTATLPSEALRKAIARHKPGFVAVSLDGPKPVHDAFRGKAGAYDEALEAIRFFKSLDGVRVCAGTTVTTRNYDHLDETFHLAVASGADQWGIHLLVPEGRAATRRDLFLSKSQLKRLIKFVTCKRPYFRVEMADEIGYLGYLEPLVRDRPLTCGAGRAQCVVLPDGAVVPCTTLDRSCSAGNIHERALMDIWTEGFADLRAWQPTGECGHCDYAIACKGGCWLQRKAGQQCFKEIWHVPGVLKTAAGIAICLGSLAATEGTARGAAPREEALSQTALTAVAAASESTVDPLYLGEAILRFYTEIVAGLDVGSYTTWRDEWSEADCNDTACQFFTDFTQGTLPEDVVERCAAVRNALETEHRSLSLIALLWRTVCGPLFEIENIPVHYEVERQEIRDTLAILKEKAEAWRLEIFAGYLDPYLSNGRLTAIPDAFRSKAGPRPGDEERHTLQKDLNRERWGVTSDPDSYLTAERSELERQAAEAYLLDHHYADQMDLVFTFGGTGELVRYTGNEELLLHSHLDGISTGQHAIGVFDAVMAVERVTLYFMVEGEFKLQPQASSDLEILLNDETNVGENDLTRTISVTLLGGREYTYVELLARIYQWNRETLLSIAWDWLPRDETSVWNEMGKLVIAVRQNSALLWPAFREMVETGGVLQMRDGRNVTELQLSGEDLGRTVMKETDFWMF